MRSTETDSRDKGSRPRVWDGDRKVVNLGSCDRAGHDRFPDVDDLIDRLTDDAAGVAHWT